MVRIVIYSKISWLEIEDIILSHNNPVMFFLHGGYRGDEWNLVTATEQGTIFPVTHAIEIAEELGHDLVIIAACAGVGRP